MKFLHPGLPATKLLSQEQLVDDDYHHHIGSPLCTGKGCTYIDHQGNNFDTLQCNSQFTLYYGPHLLCSNSSLHQTFPDTCVTNLAEWKKAEKAGQKCTFKQTYLDELVPTGFLMTATVDGQRLQVNRQWTDIEWAAYVASQVFPDQYDYIAEKMATIHPMVRRDEFIPVLFKNKTATLFRPDQKFDGKYIFEHLLVQTNRQSTRIAFCKHMVLRS
jgi:hypothetical protein